MRFVPVALLVLAACYPKAAPPPEALNPKQVELAKVKDANVTDAQLERGRQLFVDNCGNCHGHPDLSAQKLSRWPAVLEDMIARSDLDKDATASGDLGTFVMTAAEAAQAPP